MASLLHRTAGVLVSLFLAAVATTALAAPAHGEDGYQYWNYFHLDDDTWAFSQVGAADYQPEDGDVEGFRYGVSTQSQGIEPRADLTEVNFDTVCGDVEAGDGEKRVAVLLDYGTVDDDAPEPRADCAVLPEEASTQDALDQVSQVRAENGMVCALDGYPASGCGEPVPNADVPADEEPVAFAMPASADTADSAATDDGGAAADPADEGSDTFATLVLVAAVIAVLGMLALVINQRRRRKRRTA